MLCKPDPFQPKWPNWFLPSISDPMPPIALPWYKSNRTLAPPLRAWVPLGRAPRRAPPCSWAHGPARPFHASLRPARLLGCRPGKWIPLIFLFPIQFKPFYFTCTSTGCKIRHDFFSNVQYTTGIYGLFLVRGKKASSKCSDLFFLQIGSFSFRPGE